MIFELRTVVKQVGPKMEGKDDEDEEGRSEKDVNFQGSSSFMSTSKIELLLLRAATSAMCTNLLATR